MKENKKKGGIRENSGRKPTTDKKQPITVYVEESVIEKMGGADKVKFKIKFMIYDDNGIPYIQESKPKPTNKPIVVDITEKPTIGTKEEINAEIKAENEPKEETRVQRMLREAEERNILNKKNK